MARTTAELIFKLTADASGLQRTLGDAASSTRKIERSFATLGSSLQGVGKRLTMGLTLPLAAAAAVGVKELMEQGRVAAQTAAVLKSTGEIANVSAGQIDKLSQSIMRKTGFDDEAVASGANMLLTFRNVRNETGKGNDIFDRTIKLSADLSTAFGQDLTASSKQLGKALQDPVAGLTALKKVGVSFTTEQRATIKALVESGDVMGAQKIILRELELQVGGSAEAFGKTLPGKIAIAKNEFMNASAAIMGTFAPAMTAVADGVTGVSNILGALPGPVQAAVGIFGLLLAALGPVTWMAGSAMKAFALLQTVMASGKLASAAGNIASAMFSVKGAMVGAGLGVAVLGQVVGGTTGNIISMVGAGAAIGSMISPGWGTAIGAVAGLAVGFATAGDKAKTLAESTADASFTLRTLIADQPTGSKMLFFDDLAKSFDDIVKKSPQAAQAFIDQAIATGENEKAVNKLQKRLDNAGTSTGQLSQKSADAGVKLTAQGRAAEMTASMIQNLTDVTNNNVNTDIAAQQAVLNVKTGLEDYNRVIGDATSTTNDREQAMLTQMRTYTALTDATMKNADADRNGTITNKEANAARANSISILQGVAGTLAAGSPLRANLEAYIATLSASSGNYVANLILNAPDNFRSVFGQMQVNFGFGWVNVSNVGGKLRAREHGGPVSGGSPYIVGEKGPELFMPNSSGVIIPNNKLGAGGGGGSQTTNVIINTVAGDAAALERIVVDALARARRRGLTALQV